MGSSSRLKWDPESDLDLRGVQSTRPQTWPRVESNIVQVRVWVIYRIGGFVGAHVSGVRREGEMIDTWLKLQTAGLSM